MLETRLSSAFNKCFFFPLSSPLQKILIRKYHSWIRSRCERNIRSFPHFDGSQRAARFFTTREVAAGERGGRAHSSHKGVRVRVENTTGRGYCRHFDRRARMKIALALRPRWRRRRNFPKFLTVIVTQPQSDTQVTQPVNHTETVDAGRYHHIV